MDRANTLKDILQNMVIIILQTERLQAPQTVSKESSEREASWTRQIGMPLRIAIRMETLQADPLLTENRIFLPNQNSPRLSNKQRQRSARKHKGLATSAAPRRFGEWITHSTSNVHSKLCVYRCDVLPDTEPPLCAHCKQYNYDCTFFLPIQETRFKKKRAEEDPVMQINQARPPYPLNNSSDRQDSISSVRTYGKGPPFSKLYLLIYPRPYVYSLHDKLDRIPTAAPGTPQSQPEDRLYRRQRRRRICKSWVTSLTDW